MEEWNGSREYDQNTLHTGLKKFFLNVIFFEDFNIIYFDHIYSSHLPDPPSTFPLELQALEILKE